MSDLQASSDREVADVGAQGDVGPQGRHQMGSRPQPSPLATFGKPPSGYARDDRSYPVDYVAARPSGDRDISPYGRRSIRYQDPSPIEYRPQREPVNVNTGCENYPPSYGPGCRDGYNSMSFHSPSPVDRPRFSSHRHQIHPETYDGKTSVDQYLERFNEIGDWNRWDDEERAMQLTMNLRGSAKAAVSTLSRDERRSYYSVWHVLKDSFGEKNDVLVFQEQFWQRVKGTLRKFS